MTLDVLRLCDNFNTKGCPNELLFGDFCDQPIPPNYYELLNDNDDDDNNTPGTPVGDVFTDNEVLKDLVLPNAPDAYANDEFIDNDTVIYDADIISSAIDSPQNEILEN